MTDNEARTDLVGPSPRPYSVAVERIGTATVENGDEVPLLQVAVLTETGSTVIFMRAPDAIRFADLLRDHSGGLTIARTLDARAET